MTSSLRLVVIADIGGATTRHIGDEAMLEANLAALRTLIPGVAFTVVSRDPEWAAARYGVDAVNTFGFSSEPSASAEREAMLDHLLAEPAIGAPAHEIVEAVASADGVIISGGGNISSSWPHLLYERVALLYLARSFGKPAVLVGQTIGPNLGADERRLVAAALASAGFVGVREIPSLALALELGIPREHLWYQCDDALFPAGKADTERLSPPTRDRSRTSRIAVTIDPQIRANGEALFGAVVSQLRELTETTGASLVLIPHVFGNESGDVPSDLTELRLLAEQLGLSHTVVATDLSATQARQVTGAAALVISSRYHPLVFGLAAGVPCIGIYGDDYCRIKLQGALMHARLDEWAITYVDVARGGLLRNALKLWHKRDEVRRGLESCRETWRTESRERWASILRALDPAKGRLASD